MSSVSLNLAVIRIERVHSSSRVSSTPVRLGSWSPQHYSATQRFVDDFKEHSRKRDVALAFYNQQRMNILSSKLQRCINRKGHLRLLFSPGVAL